MKYRPLGNSGMDVSLISLGTMTWGEQNSEADAHSQLDMALAHGVNLIDTAEMYPVPPRAETQGRTEQYIGSWLAQGGRRDKIILATKAAGPASDPARPSHIRGGRTHFSRDNLREALHDSLRRLQTDYIDYYQLHWPDRSVNIFGAARYPYVDDAVGSIAIEETLQALQELMQEGKVRAIGVSNETPWGVAQFLAAARYQGLPRIAGIQNAYNLLNRSFESGLSEFSHRDGIGLLAYSPLAFGVLSGKYRDGARPQGARLTLFERFTRYRNPQAEQAAEQYLQLAQDHGLSATQMALAFVNSRPFVTSNIIGATTLSQLAENLASLEVSLSSELLAALDAIHTAQPNPAP